MSNQTTCQPPAVPQGTTAVAPWIIARRAGPVIEFLERLFDATEVVRMVGPDGDRIVHAEVRISGGPVMLFDGDDEWPPTPAFLRVYVGDVDDVVARAGGLGARVVTEPWTAFFGDRAARIVDPWDNLWWVHTRVFEPTAEQLAAGPVDDTELAAMARATDTLGAELRRRGAGRSAE